MVSVIDYGSQYTRLLLRAIRKLGYYSELLSPDERPQVMPDAIVLSGGPMSVYQKGAPKLPKWVFEADVPVLGICYGMQLLAKELGGVVRRGKAEYGKTFVKILRDSPIFEGVEERFQVWMSHGDEVVKVPEDFEVLAKSSSGVISVMKKGRIVAFQFHPEVHHTQYGEILLENFFSKIAELEKDWEMESVLEALISEIKEKTKGEKIIGAVSGGVDSTVAAVLAARAVSDKFLGVFVDHGLLRKNERKAVEKTLKDLGVNFKIVDASELFFDRLKGVTCPEMKRKMIGKTFIDVFEKEAKSWHAEWLLQGTIYSDVIESGGESQASRIKSHHNVGGLPKRLNLKLLEPFRYLFKDEVREIGRMLDIPPEVVNRQPFPGPGLAVRIPGEVTKEKVRMLQEVDQIFIDVLKRTGWYEKVWQAFSVLLSVKTTGVKGDERDYGYAVVLRAVWSREGMTAEWVKFPPEILEEASNAILSNVNEVTRVLYDISNKPPATIEWE